MLLRKIQNKLPRYLYVTAFGWVSRAIIAICQLISIPIAFEHLGVNKFAIFTIVTGLVSWFNLADIGLGSTTQNRISEFRAKHQSDAHFLNKLFSLMLIIFLIELIIFSAFANQLQTFLVEKIPGSYNPWLLLIVGNVYLLTGVLGVTFRVLYAHQNAHFIYINQALATIAATLSIFLVGYFLHTHLLFLMLLAWTLPQLIFLIILTLKVFPKIQLFKDLDLTFAKKILKSSIKFSAFNISGAMVLSVDYIILSRVAPSSDIIAYNIINKIFIMIYIAYGYLIMALWPVLTEAFSTGEKNKIRDTNKLLLRNIVYGTIFLGFTTAGFILFKNFILSFFKMQGDIHITDAVIVVFFLYYTIRIWTDTFVIALQSVSQMKIFAWAVPIQAIFSISLMYYLGKFFALIGVGFALCLCYLLTVSWILPLFYRKYYLKRIRDV